MKYQKNANQRRQEFKRHLNRSQNVSMSQLERKKSTEEDHDKFNVVREELKAELKVTAHTVVNIWENTPKRGI